MADKKTRLGSSYSTKRRRIKATVEADLNLVFSNNSQGTFIGTGSQHPECSSKTDSESETNTYDESCTCTIDDCRDIFDDNDDDHFVPSDLSDSDVSVYSDDQSDTDNVSFRLKLAELCVAHNVSHCVVKALLELLKPHFPGLPNDPRTLLQTPRNYSIKQVVGGQYYHFGIESGIEWLSNSSVLPSHLRLQFNCDGLPLFKSSSTEFWPIMCMVKDSHTRPFVVGLYCGKKKPASLSEYLCDFVCEIENLLHNGITLNEVPYHVVIDCFICDAPARAFLKNVKSFSGYFGCDKCCQEGTYISGRMTFPEVDCALRSDVQFDELDDDDDHRRGPTPLSRVNMGLVTQFVLDYMHLVCLGVVRKLVNYWLSGPVHTSSVVASRLPSSAVHLLSQKLVNISKHVPSEFSRKPRGVTEVDRWKATEFRAFLLYTGPVVLREILQFAVYKHFMLLSVAIYLLASPVYCMRYNQYANDLLVAFVKQSLEIYGPTFAVYNVHALIHLAFDVQQFGPLDTFSAFPFENELGCLKRMLKKASDPLPQIVRRISEKRQFSLRTTQPSQQTLLKLEHNTGPCPSSHVLSQQFKQLHKQDLHISTSPGDDCITVAGFGILRVVNILKSTDDIFLVCKSFRNSSDLYSYPLPSCSLGIRTVSNLSSSLTVIPLSTGIRKCVCLPLNDAMAEFAVMPLCHAE